MPTESLGQFINKLDEIYYLTKKDKKDWPVYGKDGSEWDKDQSRYFVPIEEIHNKKSYGRLIIGTVYAETGNVNRINIFYNKQPIGRASVHKTLENGYVTIVDPTIKKEFRGRGYGVLIYEYVLNVLKYGVMSMHQQTPGSAAIWNKLAENPKYMVFGKVTKNKTTKIVPIAFSDQGRAFAVDSSESPVYNIDANKRIEVKNLYCVLRTKGSPIPVDKD